MDNILLRRSKTDKSHNAPLDDKKGKVKKKTRKQKGTVFIKVAEPSPPLKT